MRVRHFGSRRVLRPVRLAAAIALGVSASVSAVWAVPAVSFPSLPGSGCGPHNVEGWEFQTTSSITVSALGVYDSSNGEGPVTLGDGLSHSIPVGLFDSSCTQLASVTIPAGTTATLIADYRYVGIAPLVLDAGKTFRIAAVMQCDDFTPQVNSLAQVSIDPSLTAVQTRRIAFGESLECPTETSSVFVFAPNFLIGPACGNGVVQEGEQCDDGNTTDGDCCSSTCQYETNGSPCPPDEHVCTVDVCNASGTCTHDLSPSSMVCRPAAGECDVPENCDGSSPDCPPDESEPNGTPCTDDGLFCSGTEKCEDGSCTSSGNPCAVGICDEDTDQCVAPSPSATHSAGATATSTATTSIPSTATASVTSTETASIAPTPVSTPTRTSAPAETATATPSSPTTVTPSATPTHTPPTTAPCVGDCDGSGDVAINELIIGVNIALGNQSLASCPAFDRSGNGQVEINELISAVNDALNGCG